jgi:chromate reductase, NAD(P)H dehydrogenase (quinone)
MKHIIVGTSRPDSNSKKVAQFVQKLFELKGEKIELIDLAEIDIDQAHGGHFGGKTPLPQRLNKAIESLTESEGFIFVIPEYNGSIPGVLKSFVDYWKFPHTFEGRAVAYIGLGGMWAGLRPVEHMMQVMSYRNAYNFPIRVFMRDVWKLIDKEGVIEDPIILGLLNQQVEGFQKFCRALHTEGLDANTLNSQRPVKK